MSRARDDGGVRRLVAAYRFVLWLLPRRLRRSDGAAMMALFERLVRDAAERGGGARAVYVAACCAADVAVQAVRARLRRGARGRFVDRTTARLGARPRNRPLDVVVLDVRQGVRTLARRPALAVLATVTFALGIGANTAVFSVVRGVLLRDLPYAEPERIVRLIGTRHGAVNVGGTLPYLNARDVAARSASFDAVAAYDEWRPNLTGAGGAELISGALVNAEFFDVLGVTPAVGRFFVPEEDVDGRDRVAVLGHGLWVRRFGADPGVVGSTVVLNGNPHTVVGVAAADFEDPSLSGESFGAPEIWRPLGFQGLLPEQQPSRGSFSYVAIARLRSGVTLDQARAELAALSHALEEEHPEQLAHVGMTAVPLLETIVGEARGSLLLLLGAVTLVLAIAAANVGSLLLGRASERRAEIALRSALGAGRARIASLVITETLLLAVAGGVLGLGLAAAVSRSVIALGAQFVPRAQAVTLDAGVLGFAFAVTLVTGLLCGLVPALGVVAADPRGALADRARGSTSGLRTIDFRRALVVAEFALALMLLVGAGLLGRSLWRLMSVDPGIDAHDLLTLQVVPPVTRYGAEDLPAAYDALLARLGRVPGVRSAAAVNIAPLAGGFDCNRVYRADRAAPERAERLCAEVRTVTAGYFQTAGVARLRGRGIEERDRAGGTLVAVAGEALAALLWPGEDPFGRRLVVGDTVVEVVGVVTDVKHLRLEDPAPPTLYVAHAQGVLAWQTRAMTLMLRTTVPPEQLAAAVRAQIRAFDEQLPIANLRTMRDIVARSAAPPRFRAVLLAGFALLALLLAGVGVYGVVSFSVAQRARELAVRMAVGAQAPEIVALVLRQGLLPVALGLVLGGLGAFAGSRLLASLLFGVRATDGLVFLSVPALLLMVATAAVLVPTRRALRVDPMTVLRQE